MAEQKGNCPEAHGDDFDFGAPPILKTLADGRDILLLAQKSGVVYAVDPAHRGKMLWETRIGHGGLLGGIQWGGATDSRNAYFTLSDYSDTDPLVGGGLFALDLRTGKKVWYSAPVKPECVKEYGCSAQCTGSRAAEDDGPDEHSRDKHTRKLTIKEVSRKNVHVEGAWQTAAGRGRPAWISAGGEMMASISSLPTRDDIDRSINEQLIVELYSK